MYISLQLEGVNLVFFKIYFTDLLYEISKVYNIRFKGLRVIKLENVASVPLLLVVKMVSTLYLLNVLINGCLVSL